MKRAIYFLTIEDRLNTLATRINSRGRLNLLDLHNHSENFYQYFLKELYGWVIDNENQNQINVEAIDLIDHTNRYVIQVSAINTKQKVENSLSKDLIKKYKNYTFKFISISCDADGLKKKKFKNPHEIKFTPKDDIIDKNSILTYIKGLHIDDQKRIHNFICKELNGEVNLMKLETNLAIVINILAKEDWNKNDPITEINSFQIDRKITHNNLIAAKDIIESHGIHHGRVDKIYTEFDSMGNNKSKSVLSAIAQEYLKSKGNLSDDGLFFEVTEKVRNRVMNSSNYKTIPLEELELSINILVVDAFIRCKIFENPESYSYATT